MTVVASVSDDSRPIPGESVTPVRHVDLYLSDGSIVLLTGATYFLVHQGLLSRHSQVFADLIKTMEPGNTIEGRPVLSLPDSSSSIAHLLKALYDGIHFLTYDEPGFSAVSGLLRASTKYQVHRIRNDILHILSTIWPTTLTEWEIRESNVTDSDGTYSPRPSLPHPIEVIKLARDIDAPALLPSAMYDLSRYNPSEVAVGIFHTKDSSHSNLNENDLLSVFRGREHASRYFSTFIVNDLEGRAPSATCLRRHEASPLARRACQVAFEAITFELLRVVNKTNAGKTSDPLAAMAESEVMQIRDETPDGDSSSPMRTCEVCRTEFSLAVNAAKHEFWQRLPGWFGVEVTSWS